MSGMIDDRAADVAFADDQVEHARRRAGLDAGSAPSAWAIAGVGVAGFSTTVLPKASAGAAFHAGIAIGKFHGVIRPNTPTASR